MKIFIQREPDYSAIPSYEPKIRIELKIILEPSGRLEPPSQDYKSSILPVKLTRQISNMSKNISLAPKGGFEPTKNAGFADQSVKPLRHTYIVLLFLFLLFLSIILLVLPLPKFKEP